MTMISRRLLLTSAAALALGAALPALAAAQAAVDLMRLGEPPATGEMALGPENAKVTVIEYASASCPHCANFYKTTYQDLKRDYIDTGKIRFVLREFPHNDAGLAGFMIARCAPKERYFPVLDTLFEQQETWLRSPRDGLFKIAQAAGFTKESFEACLKNEEVAKGILAERDRAQANFGVDSIPTFFINGKRFDGAVTIEAFRKIIDPLLG